MYAAACIDDSFVSPELLKFLDPLRLRRAEIYDVRRSSTAGEDDPRIRLAGPRRLALIKGHDGVETCFWVDIHADDISLWNNSPSPSVRIALF